MADPREMAVPESLELAAVEPEKEPAKPRRKLRRGPSRWHVASRVIAAAIPGFLLTNTAAIFLTFLLPGDKLTAVATATVLSFLLYTAIILWIFSARRLRTVWLGLLAALVVTGVGSWLMYTLESAP
ncbi:MAG: DUF3649 domain-containing protein [Acidobacteriota bacterium]